MLTKNKKDLIIVPFDFTEQALTALDHASNIAKHSEDEVRLLHIINGGSRKALGDADPHETLKRFAAQNEAANGIRTSYHAAEGNLFTTMADYFASSGASLVVMGTHGVKGIQHLIGPNSLRVVASSPVPVIIVQEKKISSEGYKRIVLPIDHYKHGKNKTAYAIAIAKYYNSEVFIFENAATDEFIVNQIKANSAHAVQYLQENRISYKIESETAGSGSFAREVIRYASLIEADLIVISSEHDTETVMDLIMGKQEIDIINNDAQIAVMCVNPVQNISNLDIDSFNF